MGETFAHLICPICGTLLTKEGASLYCRGARRHCYDISAAGYVNLLPPGKKNNARAGDDKEMLRCRSRFLSGGWYDPISETAARLGGEATDKDPKKFFVYAGCGE